MVIGRGRRREHPNQHVVLLLLKKIRGKKVRGGGGGGGSTGKSTKKKEKKSMRKKSTGKKYREKKYGKIRGEGKGKSHVTSGDFTSGHAQWSDPPHGSSTNVALSVPIYYYHLTEFGLRIQGKQIVPAQENKI